MKEGNELRSGEGRKKCEVIPIMLTAPATLLSTLQSHDRVPAGQEFEAHWADVGADRIAVALTAQLLPDVYGASDSTR